VNFWQFHAQKELKDKTRTCRGRGAYCILPVRTGFQGLGYIQKDMGREGRGEAEEERK